MIHYYGKMLVFEKSEEEISDIMIEKNKIKIETILKDVNNGLLTINSGSLNVYMNFKK